MTEDVNNLEWEDNIKGIPFTKHLIAGASAGVIEHISVLPLDAYKILQQSNLGSSGKTIRRYLFNRSGARQMFTGASALVFGTIPSHAFQFGIHRWATKRWAGDGKQISNTTNAAIGALSALGHDLFMVPADFIKQRMITSAYISGNATLYQTLRNGNLGRIYNALPAAMLLNVPYTAAFNMSNEYLMRRAFKLNTEARWSKAEYVKYFTSSGLSAAMAAIATCPIDNIRTAINNNEFGSLPAYYNRVMSTQGLRGFYTGLPAYILLNIPCTAVSWTAYQLMLKTL